jgi:hypothetical protein
MYIYIYIYNIISIYIYIEMDGLTNLRLHFAYELLTLAIVSTYNCLRAIQMY